MVEPDPDVPDALAQIAGQLLRQVRAAGAHVPGTPLRAEDARLGQIARLDLAEAPVQRVEVEQKAVADIQRIDRSGTIAGEPQHRVGAVAMLVDELLDRRSRTHRAGAGQLEARERVSGDVAVSGFDFAPGDRAIAVPVQPDCVLQVAQRDVPAAHDPLLADDQAEVAVARLVCAGRRRQQHRQRRQANYEEPSHQEVSASRSTSASIPTCSRPVRSSQSSTG